MTPLLLLFGAVVVFTAIAAYTDLRTGLIPNRLLLAGFILALPLHTAAHFLVLRASGEPASEVLLRALGYYGAGVGVCGLVPYLLFRYGAMGGGDVKLLAMVGGFVGPIVDSKSSSTLWSSRHFLPARALLTRVGSRSCFRTRCCC